MYKETFIDLKKTRSKQGGRFFGKDLTNIDNIHQNKIIKDKGAKISYSVHNNLKKGANNSKSGILHKKRIGLKTKKEQNTPTFKDKENIDTNAPIGAYNYKGSKKLKLNKSKMTLGFKAKKGSRRAISRNQSKGRDNSLQLVSKRSKSRQNKGLRVSQKGIKGVINHANNKQRSLSRPPLNFKDSKSGTKSHESNLSGQNIQKNIQKVHKKLQLQSQKSQRVLNNPHNSINQFEGQPTTTGSFELIEEITQRTTAPEQEPTPIKRELPGSDFKTFPELNLRIIWNYLISQKANNICRSNYFQGKQKDINKNMRAILVDWLIDVHKKFKLRPQALFMCCSLIDRVLEIVSVAKHRFQLLGITALFIASKYEEIYPPTLSDFSFVCADAYTEEDILLMEANILKALNFNLVFTSTYALLETYAFEKKFNQKAKCLLLYIQHLVLLSHKMIKYDAGVKVAASVYLAEKILGQSFENVHNLVQDFEVVDKSVVKQCAKELALLMSKEQTSRLTACKRKFKSEDYLGVSRIKVSVKEENTSRSSPTSQPDSENQT